MVQRGEPRSYLDSDGVPGVEPLLEPTPLQQRLEFGTAEQVVGRLNRAPVDILRSAGVCFRGFLGDCHASEPCRRKVLAEHLARAMHCIAGGSKELSNDLSE